MHDAAAGQGLDIHFGVLDFECFDGPDAFGTQSSCNLDHRLGLLAVDDVEGDERQVCPFAANWCQASPWNRFSLHCGGFSRETRT